MLRAAAVRLLTVALQVSPNPVTSETFPVVERLWQLYQHDMSEFRPLQLAADGTFPTRRLASFFHDPDRRAYLLESQPWPAGLALIRGLSGETRVVGEFFVVRGLRRQQVGVQAVLALLRLHPGRWEIPFQEINTGAARFWRRVATAAVGAGWTQDARPVPGKPDVPPDTWITLTTDAL